MFKVNKQKKGSVLIFSIFIMALVLVASLNLAGIATIERRSSSSTLKSIKAFQYADAGMEKILDKILSGTVIDLDNLALDMGASCDMGKISFDNSELKFDTYFKDKNNVFIEDCSELTTNVNMIKVDGLYQNSSRAIEVSVRLDYSCDGSKSLDYDGTEYDDLTGKYEIVEIGDQCWMKENLNEGVRINDDVDASDDGNIEKYCYVNDSDYCDDGGVIDPGEGGLYLWDEAMGYNSSECDGGKCQGICPTGWHIPTDEEFHTLENYYADSSCDSSRAGWDCDPAGEELRDMSDDKFNAILAGARVPSGTFLDYSDHAYILTSTEDTATSAWARSVSSTEFTDSVNRESFDKEYGFSVRCIKD